MAGTRTKISRLIAASLVATVAAGTAFASSVGADDLDPSPPELYRKTSESSRLDSSGYRGAGVTVAVIDTGVADVPGLDGVVVHQQNFSAAPAEGDQYGHGTFVTGIIHAVAPEAKVISIKLSGADGSVDASQVLAALQWVVAHRETYSIDVVNLSFGSNSKQSTESSPLNYAVQKAWDAGMVVVASAGNLGDGAGTVTKPGDDPLVITVGSSDEHGTAELADDTIPGFVSRGPTQDGLAKPDLVAPGTRLVSLRAPGSTVDTQHPEARVGEDRFRGSGTSFSAPLISGVVAQMLSADPSLSPDQIKHGLLKGAAPISGDPAAMGAGSVRAAKALQHAREGRANGSVRRSSGTGSLHDDRGSAVVDVTHEVTLLDGTVDEVTSAVTGDATAMVDGLGTVAFDQDEFLDPASWDASSWGASQWGASSWGASSWGASSWGASSWGSSQWWASSWG